MELQENLKAAGVVPVLVIKELGHAVPLAKALVDGGLTVLEITLRSTMALEAIRAISAEVGQALVGAGTVLDARQLGEAVDAGARFIVSPGLSKDLVSASRDRQVPLLPGVATASEIMQGLSLGLQCFKFFPAEACGGVAALKALGGPFPQVCFCPTGGIHQDNLADYLSLPNVIAVGGSWMVAPGRAEALAQTTVMARKARTLAQQIS